VSLFDLLQQADISQLHDEVERLRRQSDGASWDNPQVRELAEENLDLKLRLGLLVRLLIAKGVFRAEEFASLLAEARRGQ
jgi:hypothetical protein